MTMNKEEDAGKDVSNVVFGYTANNAQVEEENRILRETVNQLKNELTKFQKTPLLVCEIKDLQGDKALMRLPNGNEFFVNIAASCEPLTAGDSALVEQKNLTVVKKIPLSKRFTVEQFVIIEKPNISWSSIGGLAEQMTEIKEVIELPLKKPELFKAIGITPPKGILLHGPPGTGKTLLAKAVASSTKSTFIELVGSELVQKFIGEGAKLVKEVFQLARERAPSIIFIDEIDALASRRIEIGTSGEREVQRTFMQLLAEIDGFKHLGNVKVVGCTNRKDILDPAILRPGRLDRLIYVPVPNAEGRKEIFHIHAKGMATGRMNAQKLVDAMDGFSGAEVRSVCTEAGYFAIRASRHKVTQDDFVKAIEKVRQDEEASKDYLVMFG